LRLNVHFHVIALDGVYVRQEPIAQDRLEEQPNGKLRYMLKKPWKDGTVALVLEPLDLIARVCALVPPPRLHMVRYHGVRSSHAKGWLGHRLEHGPGGSRRRVRVPYRRFALVLRAERLRKNR